jgi:hypothetical protein
MAKVLVAPMALIHVHTPELWLSLWNGPRGRAAFELTPEWQLAELAELTQHASTRPADWRRTILTRAYS